MRATRPSTRCSAPLDILHFSCTRPIVCGSLFGNELGPEGGKAVAEVLPQTQLTSLKCAHQKKSTRASCSAPLDILHFFCTRSIVCGSLNQNALCGLDSFGYGTYTAEGINKICESLKTSSITLLRCSNAHWGHVTLFVQRPLNHFDFSCTFSPCPVHV